MVDDAILNHTEVDQIIRLALLEDTIAEDVTSLAAGLYSAPRRSRATVIARQEGVAAGYPLVNKVIQLAGAHEVQVTPVISDGNLLGKNLPWFYLDGPVSELLRLERVVLNFLMRMSGIATTTRKYVKLLEGTQSQLLHTRKTIPGHRRLDLYSCLIGGAKKHRQNLSDAILIKENHFRAAASFEVIASGVQQYRSRVRDVIVEVMTLDEIAKVLALEPTRILLDNFSVPDVLTAVERYGDQVKLEASGGIALHNIREYAQTGVHFISVGAITHSFEAMNLSMLLDFDL